MSNVQTTKQSSDTTKVSELCLVITINGQCLSLHLTELANYVTFRYIIRGYVSTAMEEIIDSL